MQAKWCVASSIWYQQPLRQPDVTQTLFNSCGPIRHHGMFKEHTQCSAALISCGNGCFQHLFKPSVTARAQSLKTPKEANRSLPWSAGGEKVESWSQIKLRMAGWTPILIFQVVITSKCRCWIVENRDKREVFSVQVVSSDRGTQQGMFWHYGTGRRSHAVPWCFTGFWWATAIRQR